MSGVLFMSYALLVYAKRKEQRSFSARVKEKEREKEIEFPVIVSHAQLAPEPTDSKLV